ASGKVGPVLTESSKAYLLEYASEALLKRELFGAVDTLKLCRRSVDLRRSPAASISASPYRARASRLRPLRRGEGQMKRVLRSTRSVFHHIEPGVYLLVDFHDVIGHAYDLVVHGPKLSHHFGCHGRVVADLGNPGTQCGFN